MVLRIRSSAGTPDLLTQPSSSPSKGHGYTDDSWWKSMSFRVGYTCAVFCAGWLIHDSSWTVLNSQLNHGLRESSSTGNDGWNQVNVYFGPRPDLGNKKWFSQVHQDEVILKLLGSNGYFIDLAANDAVEFSNTLALERRGNWRGLCIEPNPTYWYGHASHRTCDIAGALVGGNGESDKNKPVKVKFRGVYGGVVGRLDEKLANRKKEPDSAVETRYTVPFSELLERFKVPTTIDYLSLDVEGMEWDIMKDFPFDRYTIRVLTIERPNDKLKSHLNSHGYLFLKDLAWWGETIWAHKSTGLSPKHPDIEAIVTEQK